MSEKFSSKQLATLSMLFALALVFSYIEMLLPPLFVLIPGVKLGLSNIVVMFTLFVMNLKGALIVGVLKSLFVLFMRGLVAFSLSIGGAIFAILAMYILQRIFKDKISFVFLSICGSVIHNMIQLILATFLTKTPLTLSYFPLLIVSGIIMGAITGTIYSILTPYLLRFK